MFTQLLIVLLAGLGVEFTQASSNSTTELLSTLSTSVQPKTTGIPNLNGTTTLSTTTSTATSNSNACRCPASYLLVCELAFVNQDCAGDPCFNNTPPVLFNTCPCPNTKKLIYNKACLAAPPLGCPWSCDAGFNPDAPGATCDITTSCSTPDPTNPIGAPASYCACRSGYKADNAADGDTTTQWRLPAPADSTRVYVQQGVSCNTLCDDPFGPNACSEVTLLPSTCLIRRFHE